MPRKNTQNTKGRIISAAWRLFYEQGYENTTVEDIVYDSGTSKGSFYHYFESKDALMGTLSDVFDEKYEELEGTMPTGMDALEKLCYLNHQLYVMIEERVPLDLLARLLATQLFAKGDKRLLDHSRLYFRLLRQIVAEGQRQGTLRGDFSGNEIVKAYALWERSQLYDWCLCGGEYSLVSYADRMTPIFLSSFAADRGGASLCKG